MKSQQAKDVAKHILDDRSGAGYYQDESILAEYLSGSLGISESEVAQIAQDINQDRQGANYYANPEILQQLLESKVANKKTQTFKKQYSVMIDTVPLPERSKDKIDLVSKTIAPVINQIISDAITVAIGTRPQPEIQSKPTTKQTAFEKQYTVMIDTVPLPESTADKTAQILKGVEPVIQQMITDAMTVAIGTWPTPEKPTKKATEKELFF